MTKLSEQAVPKSAATVTAQLLGDKKYHIEFHQYLTNHVKHAIVALNGLNAPPSVIQRYWDEYTSVTPYGYTLEPAEKSSQPELTPKTWKSVRGKKTNFPALLRFFDAEEARLGTNKVLETYMPDLVPGAAGALTHGIIHLGWALDAGSRTMLIEGLAYMAYTFIDVHPERFEHRAHPDVAPSDSLLRISSEYATDGVRTALANVAMDPKYCAPEANFHPELKEAGFQWSVAKVLTEGHGIFLKLPAWLDELPVDQAVEGMYRAITLLYLISAGEPTGKRAGNFVTLHLITAMWGLEQVAKRLPESQQRHALKCFWASAVAIVATSSAGAPTRSTVERTIEKFGDFCDSRDLPWDNTPRTPGSAASVGGAVEVGAKGADAAPLAALDWGTIVGRAWEETEEHNIKLVYVERELWRRYGRWMAFRVAAGAFTTTPDVGPGRPAFKA